MEKSTTIKPVDMYKVMKAIIVRNGKPVMTVDVNRTVKADNLKGFRRRIKSRYVKTLMDEINVDLLYKEVGNERGEKKQTD